MKPFKNALNIVGNVLGVVVKAALIILELLAIGAGVYAVNTLWERGELLHALLCIFFMVINLGGIVFILRLRKRQVSNEIKDDMASHEIGQSVRVGKVDDKRHRSLAGSLAALTPLSMEAFDHARAVFGSTGEDEDRRLYQAMLTMGMHWAGGRRHA
jgi:hypothetical protein